VVGALLLAEKGSTPCRVVLWSDGRGCACACLIKRLRVCWRGCGVAADAFLANVQQVQCGMACRAAVEDEQAGIMALGLSTQPYTMGWPQAPQQCRQQHTATLCPRTVVLCEAWLLDGVLVF
jgi:hypothetical protein